MTLAPEQLASDLKRFVASSYPAMQIQVIPAEDDPDGIYVYFMEPKFENLYPYQRWHSLTHLIPADYQKANLRNSIWFELAPGEAPDDLRYPDDELIESIAPDVMKCLVGARFFEALDEVMCPNEAGSERARCYGDFRNARPVLLNGGFNDDELFEVFHVLMRQGGFCDCEILYNVAEESRLKAEHWIARSKGLEPYDPHKGC